MLRLVALATLAALAACGDRRAPVEKPSPPPQAGRVEVSRTLAQLVEASGQVFVGAVVAAQRGRHECHDLIQLEVVPIAKIRVESIAPVVQVFAALERAGERCDDELTPYSGPPLESLRGPAVFFTGTRYASAGTNGPEIGLHAGHAATGLPLIGVAPLDALAELARHLPPVDGELVPPLAAYRFETDEAIAVDRLTGLGWQRVGPDKPMGEVEAHHYCRSLSLGGHDDWRVPSVAEAVSLFRHERVLSSAPKSVFPALVDGGLYWTSTDDDGAFVFSPDGGVASTHYDDPGPYGPYGVLCVRAHRPVTAQPGWRVRFGDGVAIDTATRRMWHTPAKPGPPRTLEQARAYCTGLTAGGVTGWRLPTVQEMLTLSFADPGGRDASNVDLEIPTDDVESSVWTSTRSGDGADAQPMQMRDAGSFHYWGAMKGQKGNAVCVRAVPPEPTPAGEVASRYPGGAPLAIERGGQRIYLHEGGAVLWDGAVARYPSGQRAASVAGGAWTFYDRRGGPLASRSTRGDLRVPDVDWGDDYEDPIVIEGAVRDGRLEGPVRGRTRAGELRWELSFCGGLACGLYRRFAPGGVKIAEGRFEAGKATGEHREWHPNGKPKLTVHYRRGLRHGELIAWSADGKVTARGRFVDGTGMSTAYHPNGVRAAEYREVDGRPDGLRRFWGAGGELRSQLPYREGKLHGEWINWYENGQKQSVTPYRDGRTHGVVRRWYSDGTRASVKPYRDGEPHGEATEWDEQGRVRETGRFVDGKRDGVWTEYHEGKKWSETRYRAGEAITRTFF